MSFGTNPKNWDTDGDGLSDGQEVLKLGTDPFNPDTDGDGIKDGYEVQNLSMLKIPRDLWSGILHSKDYDQDGLPDGYEIRVSYYINKYDSKNWTDGKYLNPANANDAYEDFDGDGLTNLEEYRMDTMGDYDHDYRADINDKDDDNDGIPTSVEIQNHLDPFYKWDAVGDLDHDGLTNLWEYENGLNIQDKDTDHDGIDDGNEYHYWQGELWEYAMEHNYHWSRDYINGRSIYYCKVSDVDHDNITDGKEIKGYEVKIITGWDSDGNPISEMKNITPSELNPLLSYRDVNEEWTDSDNDGIPDIVESMLSNSSHFLDFYNFTHNVYNNAYSLWNDYNWTIAYYFSLKLHKNYDTIYTNIEKEPVKFIKEYNNAQEYNKSCGENATKYITSQFNPFIVENMPPVIVKFNVQFSYYVLIGKADIHAVVRDAGEIKKIRLEDSDFGQSNEWYPYTKRKEINYTFWASPIGANVGMNITIKTWDNKENYAKMSRYIYGPVGTLIKMFLDWLAQVFKWLVKIAKAVAKALNFILEWLLQLVNDTLNLIFSPLINAINSWISDIKESVSGSYDYYKENGMLNEYWKDKLNNILFGTGFYVCLGIGAGLIALFYTITALTMGTGGIVMNLIVPLLVGTIVTMILKKTYESGYQLPFNLPESLTSTAMYNIIKEFVESAMSRAKDNTEVILSFVGDILGLSGIIFTLYSAGLMEPTGTLLTEIAVGFAVWALPWYLIGLAFVTAKPVQIIFGAMGFIFSIPSLLSIVDVLKIKVPLLRGLLIGAWLLTVFSSAIYWATMVGG